MTQNSSHRVLVVEDEADTRSSLMDILEFDGYEVVAVGTIAGMRSRSDLSEFIAIILDRRLPDGLADDFLEQLEHMAPEVSRIIVTGDADFQGTMMALRHGASDYLLKPIHADCLRASLKRIRRLREVELRAVQAERLAAIGQVVASVAHESRNALQRIGTRIELMMLDRSEDTELMEDLGKIAAAKESLRCMFEELREFSAPIHLDRRRQPLRELIQQTWESLQCDARSGEATLQLSFAERELMIDPIRIEQVFRNLLENAIAARSESVNIRVTANETRHHGQPAVQVFVTDNGPGFSDELREKAFEPFFTTKSKGTGLGLAICKRIIELHGGEISVDTTFDQGASIAITLPAACEETTASVDANAARHEFVSV